MRNNPEIQQNEDIEMLVMGKSTPLSTIAQRIAEQRKSEDVIIIQSTGSKLGSCKVGVGWYSNPTMQGLLYSALMAVYSIVEPITKHSEAKRALEQLELSDDIKELLLQLVGHIKKQVGVKSRAVTKKIKLKK